MPKKKPQTKKKDINSYEIPTLPNVKCLLIRGMMRVWVYGEDETALTYRVTMGLNEVWWCCNLEFEGNFAYIRGETQVRNGSGQLEEVIDNWKRSAVCAILQKNGFPTLKEVRNGYCQK